MKTLPKVLLLGDSIRMSYQQAAEAELAGEADVRGPEGNGCTAEYTLEHLDGWLDELGIPAVVHWNNGLHDCGHNPERSPVQIPIDSYRSSLELVYDRLAATGARIIWATTTPAAPDRAFWDTTWSWRDPEIVQYNEVALAVMTAHDIPVNDLYSILVTDCDKYLCEDKLHLSEAGIALCARAAADAIRPHLPG